MGAGIAQSEMKRLEREADHTPPTGAEAKNTSFVFMALCLIS
jgi:hypothetical protein